MRLASRIYALTLSALAAVAASSSAAAQELYENNTSVDNSTWMHNATDVTLSNVTKFVGRTSSYVIGSNPGDPAANAAFSGIVIGGLVIGILGRSRAGVVAGAVAGVSTLAVLSESTGLAPSWMYPAALLLIGVLGAAVYIRRTR